MKGNAVRFLATGLLTGCSPVMPGTAGSLAAALFCWFYTLAWWQIALICALSVWICGQAEKLYGEKDPGKIVLDEFCGMFVAVWQIKSLSLIIAGFILFRLFDIKKPLFINRLQAYPGGWGIVADDLAAGLLARTVLAIYSVLA